MEAVVGALRGQVEELDSLVTGLDEASWAAPSACPGWSVRDVLVHLAQTNAVAVASAEDRWEEVFHMWGDVEHEGATADELAAQGVEANRDRSGAEVHEWWRRTAEEMVTVFSACDPRARVQWLVGDMAARTLCTTRLSETWIHTTDIAHGLAVEVEPTDRLWHVARLVHRTLPYAFSRAGRDQPGPVRFELTSPGDPAASWTFGDASAPTVLTGPAHDLCRVAGQRAEAGDTALSATGPDADGVLALARTFA